MVKLPSHTETTIITHQDKVKRIHFEEGGRVLKSIKDFYFWASWILLFYTSFLIFYMYQEKYKIFDTLDDIDAKTKLTVLGTLGGAFLGAFLAGKYNTNQVTRQLKHQSSLVENQKLDVSLKYSTAAIISLDSGRDEFKNLLSYVGEPVEINIIQKQIEKTLLALKKDIDYLNSLNLINVVKYEFYFPFYKCLYAMQHVVDMLQIFQNGLLNTESTKLISTDILKRSLDKWIKILDTQILILNDEVQKDIVLHNEINRILNEI